MATRERALSPKWPKQPRSTGVRLPDELVLRGKHRALDEKITFRELVERALREYLAKK